MVDVELVRQSVTFDSSGESLPILDKLGASSRPLANHIAEAFRRPDNSPLEFERDLSILPVLELRGSRELRHEFGTVALEPLVGVTSGGLQPLELQFDPLDV